MTKPKTPFYLIRVVYYDIDNTKGCIKRLVIDDFKVTDHIIDTLNLSFSIVDKDEYQYISHSSIISFKLIDSKKYQKDMIKLKEEK